MITFICCHVYRPECAESIEGTIKVDIDEKLYSAVLFGLVNIKLGTLVHRIID